MVFQCCVIAIIFLYLWWPCVFYQFNFCTIYIYIIIYESERSNLNMNEYPINFFLISYNCRILIIEKAHILCTISLLKRLKKQNQTLLFELRAIKLFCIMSPLSERNSQVVFTTKRLEPWCRVMKKWTLRGLTTMVFVVRSP